MDTVQVGNGSGLMIQNTGSSLLNTSHNSFRLNNVLYCPQAASNMLSINQFYLDNNCYFILTGTTFFLSRKTRPNDCCSKGWLRIAFIQSMRIRVAPINFVVLLLN
jgi:hypothetical protein